MSRLLDFNLSTPKTNKTQTSNESSIVINNTVNERANHSRPSNFHPSGSVTSNFPQQITYPNLGESPLFSSPPSLGTPLIPEIPTVTTREINVEIPSEPVVPEINGELLREKEAQGARDAKIISELRFSLDFYQELALTFSKILKSNNIDLLANIIDNSGKIILDAASLCNLISLISGSNSELIKLQYEEKEAKCLSKIKPIHKLENIKVGVLDFKLCYNNLYNTLQDKYAVSLSHVLVKERRS